MKLDIAIFSDKGTRKINEDYSAYKEAGQQLLAVVADGLGGHDKGEVASEHVVKYITEEFDFGKASPETLHQIIADAQQSLLELQEKEKARGAMKTTVVTLLVDGDGAHFAHVGDSRGYVFKRFGKYVRTLDHSVPQLLVRAGEIKEKEIRCHSERSSLLKVLGSPWEKDAVETSEKIDLKGIKAFLLCTDGFWELIEEKQMMYLLKKSQSAAEWVNAMAEIVKKNGIGKEMDNFTACAVLVQKE